MNKASDDQDEINQKIEGYVLEKLGKPELLRHFKIVNIFECFYRINIYCETSDDLVIRTNEITDSFFIKFLDGEVKSCSPPILEKRYT
tara:strand:- start:1306 stop:1569 length:264 start_codon:yes stop_codon:yes gene_type:complete